jgi:aryl-alcohol dehydrogenase-like predicted oxidoreductase
LAAQAIEASVAESRWRLRLDCLPVVLFHRESDAQHAEGLLRLQARGWLRQAGVSCDNQPGPAQRLVAERAWSALQVPANVLDRRHEHSGLFAQAAARGVSIYVRSVFLQGLLLMPEALIPPSLRQVVPARQVLAAIAAEGGLSLAELAVRYLLAQTGVTCILAGVETVAQVRENVSLVARGPLPTDLLKAVNAAVPKLPASLLTPSQWPALAEAAAPSAADNPVQQIIVSEDAAHDQK